MSQGMVKIDTVVREALVDKGYDSLHLYARYLHFALRMLRKLNIDYSEDIKTVRLPVSKKKTVAYPEDYIAYNKIGAKVGDRMLCFVKDSTITSHHEDKYTPNTPFYQETENAITTFQYYNYYGGASSYFDYVDVKGYGHNGVGYFTEVDRCKEFQLSSEITSSEVILEYIATNFNPDSETYVPMLAQDTFREYIHWQTSRFGKNIPISKVREDEREFFAELGNYKMRLSDLSYEGLVDAKRRNATLAIKG